MQTLPHSSLTTRALATLPEAPEIERATQAIKDACLRARHGSNKRIQDAKLFLVFRGNMWMDETGCIEPEYERFVGDVIVDSNVVSIIALPDLNVLAVRYPRMLAGHYQVITPNNLYKKFGPDSKHDVWEDLINAMLGN